MKTCTKPEIRENGPVASVLISIFSMGFLKLLCVLVHSLAKVAMPTRRPDFIFFTLIKGIAKIFSQVNPLGTFLKI
jgi:hypothetical protein